MGKLTLLLVLAAIAIAAAFWFDRDRPSAAVKAQIAPAENGPPSASTLPAIPASPTNAPEVAGDASTLKERADAGDVQAACRFAYAASKCAVVRALDKYVFDQRKLLLQQEGAPGFDAKWAALDQKVAEYAPAYRTCEAIPAADQRDAWRYLLRAAQAGHVPSMIRFVSAAGLERSGRPLDTLDQWIAYRQEMPALLERAVAAGSVEAYNLAAHHYAHLFPHGQSPVTRDLVRSLAFRLAVARSSDTPVVRDAEARGWAVQAGLDVRQIAAAEEMASALAEKVRSPANTDSANGGCDSAWETRAAARNSPPPSPSRGP